MSTKLKILVVTTGVALLAAGAWAWYWYGYGAKAMHMARSDDARQRHLAAKMLAPKGNDAARQTLRRLSNDPDLRVALAAVRALGVEISDENRLLLNEICKTAARGNLRGAAAAALGRHEQTPLSDLIYVMRSDEDPAARAGGAEGLSYKRDPKAFPALIQALDDPALEVRVWAITAVKNMLGSSFSYHPAAPRRERLAGISIIKAEAASAGDE